MNVFPVGSFILEEMNERGWSLEELTKRMGGDPTTLIDRFGPPGTKAKPGATYGLTKDLWQAFALAVYVNDTEKG